MGKCNIDHSHEDVVAKLESQKEFMPDLLAQEIGKFLTKQRAQGTLNELFHLLKKYDLASESEQAERNRDMTILMG